MTIKSNHIENIIILRKEGKSYLEISKLLNISPKSTKKYSLLNNLEYTFDKCIICGNDISIDKKVATGPKIRYCSVKCRKAKNEERRNNLRSPRRILYKKQCIYCLICFETYRDEQKYCSRICCAKDNGRKRIQKALDEIKKGTKKCHRCHKTKPLTEFNKCKSNFTGYAYHCKKCTSLKWQKTYLNHGHKYAEKKKLYKQTPEGKARAKEYLIHRRPKRREYEKSRAVIDTKFRLNRRMRVAINCSLRYNKSKNGRKWEDIVGYTIKDLEKYLERKFLPGMTWDNYGKDWHIDHIIPISAFNFSKPEDIDFKRCWALKNLRPLWAKDNIEKKDRIERPFQPCLKLAIGM